MTIQRINAELSVTDHLNELLGRLYDDNKGDRAYERVLDKVLSYVDKLNWDLVLRGERYLSKQRRLRRD